MKRRKTWWGARWSDSLDLKPLRKTSGRSSVSTVKLEGVDLDRSEALLLVSGGSVVPQEVRIRVEPLSDELWERAAGEMGKRALFAASLLVGELPRRLEDVFRRAGATLFPEPAQVTTRCDCGMTPPCRHAALAHHALADAIEADPFLLLELRGRRPETILEILGLPEAPAGMPSSPEAEELSDRPLRQASGDLTDFHFHIAAPERPGALLSVLGNPRGWRAGHSLKEELEPFVTAAAQRARDLALAEVDEEED